MIGAALNHCQLIDWLGTGRMKCFSTSKFQFVIGFLLMLGAVRAGAGDFLPPVLAWKGTSEALIAKAEDPWITPAEKTGLTETPSYDETVAYLKKLDKASPLISLREFGRTAQGRPLYVVIASKNRALTPEAARRTGRPTLLAQAGIHSGEIDGKDAGLMLLRDIAFRGKASLLDSANFLLVPIFNADGHERSSEWSRPNQRGPVRQGWRTTAQNLNLNRDYMKADAPEMQAMLRLINEWTPALYIDLHVTDGMDYQYDITFGYNGDASTSAWSPQIASWLNRRFRPAIEAALKTAGHTPGELVFEIDDRDPTKGLSIEPAMPRFSGGYGDLRHLPTVLVENHSLKPYRQRVLGTYILLEASMQTLGTSARELQAAIATDRAARPASVPVNWSEGGGGQIARDFLGVTYETFVSAATGGTEIRWLGAPKLYPALPVTLGKADVQLRRPKAYWVPASKSDVISRLKLHGVQIETISSPRSMKLEMYRLINPRALPSAGVHPFEGRHTLTTSVKAETRLESFPTGSVRVSTDQPLGDLAMALLEPECRDSLLAWGFFLEILQRTEYIEGYVVAPMAERMLADNPKLKAEFEAKLTADPNFANDAPARRRWFYERSHYYDDRHLLYPVGIER